MAEDSTWSGPCLEPSHPASCSNPSCRPIRFWRATASGFEDSTRRNHHTRGVAVDLPIRDPLRAAMAEPGSYFAFYDEEGEGHGRATQWDISWGCTVGFAYNDQGVLHFYVSLSDDSGSGHVQRSVSPEQLRDFACRLIELAGQNRDLTENEDR